MLLLLLPAVTPAQTGEQWRDSLAAVSRQIELNPKSVALRLHKAAINLELSQWDYAIDEYNMILKDDPKNMSALFFRAYANNNMRRYLLARNDYNAILDEHPRSFEARLGLAYTFSLEGKKKEALDQMNTLVEQHPDSATAYIARANQERELRQYDAALYDYQKASELSPADRDLLVSRADILIRLGRRDEARNVLDEAVKKGMPMGMLREWYNKVK